MATLILNLTEEQIIAINQLAAEAGKNTHEFVIGRALGIRDLVTPPAGGGGQGEGVTFPDITSSATPVVIETKGEESSATDEHE